MIILQLILPLILLLASSSGWAYTPPKGIPNPSASFSTFGEIDQATPSHATKCPNWPAAETTGCYYIDDTNGSCSDVNTYGYTNVPRCTPPEGSLAAGAFVYIHAGTYTAAENSEDRWQWHGAGTASNPIWITGNPTTKPIFTDKVHIGAGGNASYVIFENFEIYNAEGFYVAPGIDYGTVNNIIVRNNEIHGNGNIDDTEGFNIGHGTGGNAMPNALISYIVAYNNEVYDFGAMDNSYHDQVGIYISYHSYYVWVLNNTVHDVSGDSIGGCHYCNGTTMPVSHLFIGGNTMYATFEDCIDLKSIRYVIISENTCYAVDGEGAGAGVVLHYGENSVPVQDAYVIFNKISGQNSGISVTLGQDIYLVGNIIYDIEDRSVEVDILDGTCFGFRGTTGTFHVVDNTCYDYATGLAVQQGSLSEGTTLKIHGNIFSARNDAAGYEINIGSGDEAYVDMDYNRFYNSAEAVDFMYQGESHNLAGIQGHSECAHCSEGDPGLSNPPTSFTLSVGSACIGANVEGPVGATVYDAFYTAYSLSIEKDYAGVARPQNTTWDIGAYEYYPGGSPTNHINLGVGIGIGAGISIQ